MMQVKRLSFIRPVLEPVEIPEAKRQCFVTSDDDDILMSRLIAAARSYAEKELWRAITPANYIAFSDQFPAEIVLPNPPLISVDKVEYINTSGTLTELATSAYEVDALSDPARIMPTDQWPMIATNRYNAVRVTYSAGYFEEPEGEEAYNNAPETIKHAILMMVKHFYDNPEAVVVNTGTANAVEVPKGVQDLLNFESARTFA